MRFEKLTQLTLIVGNARSGSTVLGAILDAHPRAVVANETAASTIFWRDLDREAILQEIFNNSAARRRHGRTSEGYDYSIATDAVQPDGNVLLAGDKIWNPATLLLAGDYGLLPRLEKTLGVPVRLINAVRHPFDVIATMNARSGAPLADRVRWFFMHCEALMSLRERFDESRITDSHLECLIDEPESEIPRLCAFLKLDCPARYLAACKERLFREPKQTRDAVLWDPALADHIRRRMRDYPFLDRYAIDQ